MRLTRLLIACVVLCSAISVRASCPSSITCSFHHQECYWYGDVYWDDAGVEVCVYECVACPVQHTLSVPGN